MGRGLSELQKRILGILYRERQRREADGGGRYFDAGHAEVLAALYDWPIRSWHARNITRTSGLRHSEGGRAGGGHNFDREEIGVEEYNRRTASYYRAFSRLKRRGLLAQVGNPGVERIVLTEAGVREVEATVDRKAAEVTARSNG